MKLFGTIDNDATREKTKREAEKAQRVLQDVVQRDKVDYAKKRILIEQEIDELKKKGLASVERLNRKKTRIANDIAEKQSLHLEEVERVGRAAEKHRESVQVVKDLTSKLNDELSRVDFILAETSEAFKEASDMRTQSEDILTKARQELSCVQDVKDKIEEDNVRVTEMLTDISNLVNGLIDMSQKVRSDLIQREMDVSMKMTWIINSQNELKQERSHLKSQQQLLKTGIELMEKKYGKR